MRDGSGVRGFLGRRSAFFHAIQAIAEDGDLLCEHADLVAEFGDDQRELKDDQQQADDAQAQEQRGRIFDAQEEGDAVQGIDEDGRRHQSQGRQQPQQRIFLFQTPRAHQVDDRGQDDQPDDDEEESGAR